MWVLMVTELRGLSFTLTVSPLPNPVLAAKGERSEMLLLISTTFAKLVKPAKGDRSEMLFPLSPSVSKLVKPESGEMFVIPVPRKCQPRQVDQARKRREIRDIIAKKLQPCQVS